MVASANVRKFLQACSLANAYFTLIPQKAQLNLWTNFGKLRRWHFVRKQKYPKETTDNTCSLSESGIDTGSKQVQFTLTCKITLINLSLNLDFNLIFSVTEILDISAI